MKKLSIFLVLLLTLSMLAVSVLAAQTATMTVTVSDSSVTRGDTFTVIVNISSVDNCEAAGFMFDYDASVFEYIDGRALISDATGAGITTVNNILAGWFAKEGGMAIQGDLFEVTLKVKDNAAFGEYTISGIGSINSGAIDCATNAATITVCNHTYICTDNGDGTHTTACACGDISVENEAHIFVDGTCACGATEVLTDANLKFYYTNDSGADLMLGDEIKGSFMANVKNLTYDSYFVEFKMGDTITNVEVCKTYGNYRYFYYTVFASHMTEEVTVTICGVKGDDIYRGETRTWCVRDSIMAKLDSWYKDYTTDAKKAAACDLLANMLNYGTEAQKEFNSANTNYPTDGLAPEYLALIKTTTPEMGTAPSNETGATADLYSMGLMLKEKIDLYAIFKITKGNFSQLSDYTAVVELVGADGTTSTFDIASDKLEVSGTSTRYITVRFDKIKSNQMRDTLKITLYKNGEAASATIVRTPDMIVNSKLSAYPTLVPAIMNYSDCAEIYFAM